MHSKNIKDNPSSHLRSPSSSPEPPSSSQKEKIIKLTSINNTKSSPTENIIDEETFIKNENIFDPNLSPCRNIHSVYERVDSIDQGVYGSVHKGKNTKTGEIVALKKVKIKAGHRNGFPITALRETNLLLSLKHQNIVDVREVVFDKIDNGIFMVMEYMEHDLKRVMNHFMKNPFTISEVKCLIKQLLKGIAFMHENWVLHRDLKTSNLLYDNLGRLKICDFGMARKYGDPLGNYSPNIVTLWYRSPELLLGSKKYGTAVDMWSAGVIMAELLLKKGLFEGKSEMDQLDKIFRVLGPPTVTVWPGVKDLPGYELCVNDKVKAYKPSLRNDLNVNGRLIISEMGLTLLKSLLRYNPRRRISAMRALQSPWFSESPRPQSMELMPTFPSRSEVKKRKKIPGYGSTVPDRYAFKVKKGFQ